MDFDWGHHHVIYHGWDRPGWVNHARPYVHVRHVYINRSRPSINQTWRHDRSHGDPARYLASRPSGPNADRYARMGEARGSITIQPRPAGGMYGRGGDASAYSNRGRESRGTVDQQRTPATPGFGRRTTIPPPSIDQRSRIPLPHISEPRTPPAPYAGQRPVIPVPGGGHQPEPVTPHAGDSGSNQPRPARWQQPAGRLQLLLAVTGELVKPGRRAFAARTSRQSSEQARPSAPPPGRGTVPANKDDSGDRQRR